MFGDPPDMFDNDPKIYLFLYEMEAYGSFSFDGYFKNDDVTNSAVSNHLEMLHINTLLNSPESDYMLSVQAHEFQHLIHWAYDANEDTWLNEAMAELAMVLTGFEDDQGWIDSWVADPSVPLVGDELSFDYGVVNLFGTYLWEVFGDGFIGDLVADPDNGVSSLDSLLQSQTTPTDYDTVLGDFALAVAVNDVDLDSGQYGFSAVTFDQVDSNAFLVGTPETNTVPGSSGFAFMRSLEETDDLTLVLTSTAWETLEVRVAFSGPSGGELVSDVLDGEATTINLGTWPAGAILWVTAANSGAADQDIEVSLE